MIYQTNRPLDVLRRAQGSWQTPHDKFPASDPPECKLLSGSYDKYRRPRQARAPPSPRMGGMPKYHPAPKIEQWFYETFPAPLFREIFRLTAKQTRDQWNPLAAAIRFAYHHLFGEF